MQYGDAQSKGISQRSGRVADATGVRHPDNLTLGQEKDIAACEAKQRQEPSWL